MWGGTRGAGREGYTCVPEEKDTLEARHDTHLGEGPGHLASPLLHRLTFLSWPYFFNNKNY